MPELEVVGQFTPPETLGFTTHANFHTLIPRVSTGNITGRDDLITVITAAPEGVHPNTTKNEVVTLRILQAAADDAPEYGSDLTVVDELVVPLAGENGNFTLESATVRIFGDYAVAAFFPSISNLTATAKAFVGIWRFSATGIEEMFTEFSNPLQEYLTARHAGVAMGTTTYNGLVSISKDPGEDLFWIGMVTREGSFNVFSGTSAWVSGINCFRRYDTNGRVGTTFITPQDFGSQRPTTSTSTSTVAQYLSNEGVYPVARPGELRVPVMTYTGTTTTMTAPNAELYSAMASISTEGVVSFTPMKSWSGRYSPSTTNNSVYRYNSGDYYENANARVSHGRSGAITWPRWKIDHGVQTYSAVPEPELVASGHHAGGATWTVTTPPAAADTLFLLTYIIDRGSGVALSVGNGFGLSGWTSVGGTGSYNSTSGWFRRFGATTETVSTNGSNSVAGLNIYWRMYRIPKVSIVNSPANFGFTGGTSVSVSNQVQNRLVTRKDSEMGIGMLYGSAVSFTATSGINMVYTDATRLSSPYNMKNFLFTFREPTSANVAITSAYHHSNGQQQYGGVFLFVKSTDQQYVVPETSEVIEVIDADGNYTTSVNLGLPVDTNNTYSVIRDRGYPAQPSWAKLSRTEVAGDPVVYTRWTDLAKVVVAMPNATDAELEAYLLAADPTPWVDRGHPNMESWLGSVLEPSYGPLPVEVAVTVPHHVVDFYAAAGDMFDSPSTTTESYTGPAVEDGLSSTWHDYSSQIIYHDDDTIAISVVGQAMDANNQYTVLPIFLLRTVVEEPTYTPVEVTSDVFIGGPWMRSASGWPLARS